MKGWDRIDLLKLDAECAEFILLGREGGNVPKWLYNVGCITMELHPFCPDNKGGFHNISHIPAVMASFDFNYLGKHGEVDMWCSSK